MGDSSTGKAQPRVSTEEPLAGLDIDEAGQRLTQVRVDALRAQVGLPRKSQAA